MKSFRGAGRLLGIALACALLVVLPLACKPESSGSSADEYSQWRAGNPDIDARGGDVYSFRGQFSPAAGYAGAGGLVDIDSVSGTITIERTAAAITPPTQTLSGGVRGGLRIGPGEIVHIEGGHCYDWVDVEAGSTLVLTGNTTLIVGDPSLADGLGAVYVGGTIQSSRYETLDGYILTILAKGTVYIPGVIDCSGGDGDEAFGGDGGEVYIATTDTSAESLIVTGNVSASGGGSEGAAPVYGAGGDGGQVTLSTSGDMRIQGGVRARGGDSLTSLSTTAPSGGTIQLTATGSITMTGILQISARGGDGDGTPGAGGTVSIAAAANPLNLLAVRILADGGDGLRGCLSDAGDGGTIDLSGVTVTSSAEILNRGGSILSDRNPYLTINFLAGDGGTITITGTTNVAFTGGTVSAEGGGVELDGFVGAGGALEVITTGGLIQAAPAWTGTVDGGIGVFGEKGARGTACVTGTFTSADDEAHFYDQLPYGGGACGS
ncbi:MAG: hypothetical protein JXP34_26225 [Planctomycetes bacterium]|nr:hypothetical protein [Planctomycetota bacterium]